MTTLMSWLELIGKQLYHSVWLY